MAIRDKEIEILSALDQINVISDPRRLDILQMLMVEPRTISQIGREIGEYPAAIRYHIKKVKSYQAKYVTVSGGEPLAQKESLILLFHPSYKRKKKYV